MLGEFYYKRLESDSERQMYDYILSALRRGDEVISGITVDRQKVPDIMEAIKQDHPELFYFVGPAVEVPSPAGKVALSPAYIPYDRALFEKRLAAIEEKICQGLDSSSTEYDICKAVFDYLAKNVEYDYDALDYSPTEEQMAAYSPELISFIEKYGDLTCAYGPVVRGKGICGGISCAFMLLCNRLGVECNGVAVDTRIKGVVSHNFNVVEIGGKRYFVDVTCALPRKDLNLVDYRFFLFAEEELTKDYISPTVPFDCVNKDFGFYHKENLLFENKKDLRYYLNGLCIKGTPFPIYIKYVGEDLEDKKLGEMVFDILNDRCGGGCYFAMRDAEKGFCTGLVSSKK